MSRLEEQKRYYAARAPEYEDWWWRRGRYALEPDAEARWYAPGGRVFLVDNNVGDRAHTGTDQADGEEARTVADGRAFRIVKRRWEPDALAARVRPLGFELELTTTANGHFLVGGGGIA